MDVDAVPVQTGVIKTIVRVSFMIVMKINY